MVDKWVGKWVELMVCVLVESKVAQMAAKKAV